MELSRFTDYSLRTLIYIGTHAEKLITVPEIAAAYGISENHLVKIAHKLGKLGFLETKRGRGGGLRLALSPEKINIGSVIRETESLALVDCLGADGGSCAIKNSCVLKRITREALDAFIQTFDRYTLADLIRPKAALMRNFAVTSPYIK